MDDRSAGVVLAQMYEDLVVANVSRRLPIIASLRLASSTWLNDGFGSED
jgi:hypothetical protein